MNGSHVTDSSLAGRGRSPCRPPARRLRSGRIGLRFLPLWAAALVLGAGLPAPATAQSADDKADAKKQLDAAGLKVSGSQVILADEVTFTRDLGRATALRTAMQKAGRELAAHDAAMARGRDLQSRLRAEHVRLSTLMAGTTNADPATSNRLVGALNAVAGQINQLVEERDKGEATGRDLRAGATDAREAFLAHILGLRKQADALTAAYAERAGDDAVEDAVAAAGTAAGKALTFGPGSGFRTGLKKLADLEDTVLSESIPLTRDRGTLAANVVVNGGKPRSMIVDSGCSTLLVPAALASEFEVVPAADDEPVECFMADGRTVRGVRKTLRSVRVGKFTVDNVECVVLGPDAVGAELLLGMGFLRNFKFEIDADAGTLSLVRIDGK
jgi:clan AA aspartic protease (TIGR02281 family)